MSRRRLETLSPVEHELALLERLRATEPARVGDSPQGILWIDSVPDEPRAHDDAGPPAAGPAVHVDNAARGQLGVDLVEDLDQLLATGNREVADRSIDVPEGFRDERGVWLELTLVCQVDEERHACVDEVAHFDPRVLGPPGRRMAPGDEATVLDDGGRTHECTSVPTPRYPVRGERLIRQRARADSGGMASPHTSATELRDHALLLAKEHGIDPAAWYVRVLEEERKEGLEPDLGALVRAYWELQRVTGRADLRDTWRALADQLWAGEAA